MALASFEVKQTDFETQALSWSQQFVQVCFLQSNDYKDNYSAFESILAVDADAVFESKGKDTFAQLENFRTKYPNKWMLGFFGYDLKNELEDLSTSYSDELGFPDSFFFIPKTVLKFQQDRVEIESEFPEQIFEEITNYPTSIQQQQDIQITVERRLNPTEYYYAFDKMKEHIKRGDIYEVNLCQEFYAQSVDLDPLHTFIQLNRTSPTPFASYFKVDNRFIIAASPERFLAKRGETLISQPIKGTAPRGKNEDEDRAMIKSLRTNPKEIAENVMIVDLVRNDMTRSASPGTVAAERRLEVHSFQQVHQLISTITCTIDDNISDITAIQNIFPPGSMTGAPKIRAMQLCDKYERSKRGVYSGAVGYFSPQGDFDFNVVIRTILYNRSNRYLSFHTGGAITIDAIAENEYNECLLKASAILHALHATLV